MRKLRSSAPLILLLSLIMIATLSSTITIARASQACSKEFKCGVLEVPLDYTKQDSEKIKISYAIRALDSSKPKLFINPGGPGGSGLNYLFNYKKYFTKELYSNFTLVALDTRGSGSSDPIRCLSDAQEDTLNNFNPFNTSKENYGAFNLSSAILSQKCKEKYGSKLEAYNLDNIVRDYHSLMLKLGEKKFNFFGKSYGSAIAIRFSEIYPNQSNFLIADGVVNPNLPLSVSIANHQKALIRSYNLFVKYTSIKSTPLGKAPLEVTKSINQILWKLSKPVSIDNSKYKFDQSALIAAIIASLYQGQRGYDTLIKELIDAKAGEYSALHAKAQGLIGRDKKGKYMDMVDYSYIITCQSTLKDRDFLINNIKITPNVSPLTDYLAVYIRATYIPCAHFANQPIINKSSPSKILLLSNLYDPITPNEDALLVKEQNKKAILLTNAGTTHTVYALSGPCADNEVFNYLSTGQVTKTSCSVKQ